MFYQVSGTRNVTGIKCFKRWINEWIMLFEEEHRRSSSLSTPTTPPASISAFCESPYNRNAAVNLSRDERNPEWTSSCLPISLQCDYSEQFRNMPGPKLILHLHPAPNDLTSLLNDGTTPGSPVNGFPSCCFRGQNGEGDKGEGTIRRNRWEGTIGVLIACDSPWCWNVNNKTGRREHFAGRGREAGLWSRGEWMRWWRDYIYHREIKQGALSKAESPKHSNAHRREMTSPCSRRSLMATDYQISLDFHFF